MISCLFVAVFCSNFNDFYFCTKPLTTWKLIFEKHYLKTILFKIYKYDVVVCWLHQFIAVSNSKFSYICTGPTQCNSRQQGHESSGVVQSPVRFYKVMHFKSVCCNGVVVYYVLLWNHRLQTHRIIYLRCVTYICLDFIDFIVLLQF